MDHDPTPNRRSVYRYASRSLYRWSPLTIVLTLALLAVGHIAVGLTLLVVAVAQLVAAAWLSNRAKAES
jgi:hypothetical protein